MTPCGMMPEPKADLYAEDFDTAWQEIVRKTADLQLSEICAACPNREICHSCAAMALTETGTVSGVPKYLCNMADAIKHIAEKELNEKYVSDKLTV